MSTIQQDAYRILMSLMVAEAPAERNAIHEELKQIALRQSDAVFDVFLYGLDNIEAHVREGAVRALAWSTRRDVTADLIRVSTDPDPNVRRAAVQVLGRIGGQQAIVALIRRLYDSGQGEQDEPVWETAAEFLERIDDPQALAGRNTRLHRALPEALSDPDVYYRRAAAILMGESPQAVKYVSNLVDALKDADGWVRAYSIEALSKAGIALKPLVQSPYRPEEHQAALSRLIKALKATRRDRTRPEEHRATVGEMARTALQMVEEA
jgi:HEAT repeat protein